MNKILSTFNKIIDSIGLIYGITNLQEILGVIVLILTIINILTGYGFKIYDKIKNKKYNEIPNEVNNAINEIKDEIDKSKKDD